ncbi:hypothetical protein Tco_0569253 [Tanacetum coccineum]
MGRATLRDAMFYAAEILLALEYENGFHKRVIKDTDVVQLGPHQSSVSSSNPGTSPFFLPVTSGSLRVESLVQRRTGILMIRTHTLKDEGSFRKLCELDLNTSHSDVQFRGNVRDAISLPRNTPSGSSPLCSICQHKAPIFGKPPRWFSFVELELATNRFSQDNFLATQRDTSRWTGGCCKTTQTGNLSRGS